MKNPFLFKYNKRNVAMVIFTVATLSFFGCGEKHRTENVVNSFLEDYMKNNNISDKKFSKIDSTFYITDSMINVMHTNITKDNKFKSGIKYGKHKGKKLILIKLEYKSKNSDISNMTFYLDKDLQYIIAVKEN